MACISILSIILMECQGPNCESPRTAARQGGCSGGANPAHRAAARAAPRGRPHKRLDASLCGFIDRLEHERRPVCVRGPVSPIRCWRVQSQQRLRADCRCSGVNGAPAPQLIGSTAVTGRLAAPPGRRPPDRRQILGRGAGPGWRWRRAGSLDRWRASTTDDPPIASLRERGRYRRAGARAGVGISPTPPCGTSRIGALRSVIAWNSGYRGNQRNLCRNLPLKRPSWPRRWIVAAAC